MLKQLHHKKNELFEVEFFQNEECTVPFDFTNAKNLYIELKDGDITPLHHFSYNAPDYNDLRMFTPYLPYNSKTLYAKGYRSSYEITTLDDITPNLSKYIPEDNAVIASNMNYDFCEKYFFGKNSFIKHDYWAISDGDILKEIANNVIDKSICELKKLTIFLPHGTQSELKKQTK